jgi:hypothetical protein
MGCRKEQRRMTIEAIPDEWWFPERQGRPGPFGRKTGVTNAFQGRRKSSATLWIPDGSLLEDLAGEDQYDEQGMII